MSIFSQGMQHLPPIQLHLFSQRQARPETGAVQCALAPPTANTVRRENPKTLGAFYTDSQVAEFLVGWALRTAADSILDPAFGGGVFLRAACKRLGELGGSLSTQVFGVELDAGVHQLISEKLGEDGVTPANLLASDFFAVGIDRLRPVDVVVGNPPFIRYQRFSGEVRQRALARAAEQGLKLSELSSSWLPFLVHSIGFLKPGGRIAMVIPFEIGHASYASPVLRLLDRWFENVTFLTFRQKLFPDLSQDTLLLLADGKGEKRGGFYLRDLSHAGALASVHADGRRMIGSLRRMDRERVADGRQRIIEYLLPQKARDLYAEMLKPENAVALGDLADVGIGYVTGANDFFHLDPRTAEERGIPEEYLRPSVRRGRALAGLRFTERDWWAAVDQGDAGLLLTTPRTSRLPASVADYIRYGEQRGVNSAYKCRTRTPWHRVPHVHLPDAFLTYMSGDAPRLVANEARVVAPNTLHVLRLHRNSGLKSDSLATLWQTSLTRLSVEIEGHAMGGGMLKLEPGEAERVVVPAPPNHDSLGDLAAELDHLSRSRGMEACSEHADRQLLQRRLGLSAADIRLLRESALALRERRTCRSVPNARCR
jgi:adenine-specific DNA methylase